MRESAADKKFKASNLGYLKESVCWLKTLTVVDEPSTLEL